MTERKTADIDASRKRLNVPADYQWSECAAGCGDIVWHPPLEVLHATAKPVVIICSAECALVVALQAGRS